MTEAPTRRRCPLSPIELAVLRSLAEGNTRVKAMSDAGFRRTYGGTLMSRMFTKANAVNITHLVAIALREGWIR